MTTSSFYTDGAPNTGVAVAGPSSSAFYADPAAAANSATQAAASAASAATSASGAAAAAATAAAAAVASAAGTATPIIDGTASVGASTKWAHEDHVHPTDTSRAAVTYVDGKIGTATPLVAGTASVGTSAKWAHEDHVHPADTATPDARIANAAGTVTPTMAAGTAVVGTSTKWAHEDHVHPTDTSRASVAALSAYAPLANPALTGAPTAPTASVGTNTTQLATTAFVLANSGGGGGAPTTPNGRITLTSLVPVPRTSVAAATRVYYTPYGPPSIPLYNGTAFVQTAFTEVFQDTTDTTKSPAAVVANSNYDLFGWLDGATFRVTRGPAWTSGTARGTGSGTTELVWVLGTPLNANAITNGPAAQRGTYLGTIRSNGSSSIDFIYGAAASGGLAGVFNVWNCYNRKRIGCEVIDIGASYVYATATVRQARSSAGMQVSFVVGIDEDAVTANYFNLGTSAGTAAWNALITGLGLDTTTALNGGKAYFNPGVANTITGSSGAYAVWNSGIGAHYVAALEMGDTSNNTFNASGASTVDGLAVTLLM